MLGERTGVATLRSRSSSLSASKRLRLGWLLEAAAMIVLGGAIFVVHDVHYLLSQPYWVDEAWVADSIRAPIHQIPFLTSSTPIGFTLLLRLVPHSGTTQTARLVPLGFAGLAAAAGYLLGRELRISRYVTGLLIGLSVLLCPAMLIRDDLKQYTAEGFATVVLLILVARLENEWSRRRLIAIGVFTVFTLLFATATVFVCFAALGGVGIEALVSRSRTKVLEVVAVSAASFALAGGLYEWLISPNVIPGLKAFWDGYYLPADKHSIWVIYHRMVQLAPSMGFRNLAVDTVLALAGTGVLIRTGRYALAATLPCTLIISVVAGVADAYPFGVGRTSTYWLVIVPILMAVAVARASLWAAQRWLPLSVAVLGLSTALWVWTSDPSIRSHPLPQEDVRDQVAYLNSHFHSGDVIIVYEPATFAFAFYEHRIGPVYVHFGGAANGFLPEYPHDPSVIGMQNRDPLSDAQALAQAQALISAEPPAARGRVWIVLSHLVPAEEQTWSADLVGKNVSVIRTGPEPLLLYTPPAAPK